MSETDPFTADVVAQIMRHMNEDHAGDSRMIVQALGGRPDAESALMSGMDAEGIDFVAVVGGAEVPVRIAWSERLTERIQVRREVVRMSDEARGILGMAPRDGR
ncbi:DUF2470 domain-containing protein [Actinomadura fulvescens]|uniref:DUF2470 domain-containing protein n=1 Tax=Actinomadura fulvescens TaxID=46160 RepID=A0ABN3PN27_9ACTN